MRKLMLSSLVLLFSLAACKPKHTSGTTTKNREKTEQDMLDIYKQVKTYAHKPSYAVEFSQDACGYEILINGVPLHRYLLFGSTNGQQIQINDHILNSGKQEIVIRLFPPQLSDQSWSDSLVDASKFKIKVFDRTAANQQVFEFSTPQQPGTTNFIGSGQKVFEFKGYFDAKVPYELEGWRNSIDLSKANQTELLKEAVAVYSNFRNVLIKKDLNAYAALMYDKEVELAKAFYWNTAADSKTRWEEMSGTVLEKREILPLKDFKMVLYAGGKVLALQPTSEMYRDYLSAIHAQTNNDDIQISFLLHKKPGHYTLSPIR